MYLVNGVPNVGRGLLVIIKPYGFRGGCGSSPLGLGRTNEARGAKGVSGSGRGDASVREGFGGGRFGVWWVAVWCI